MTVEEVKDLHIGDTVTVCKEGHEPISCIVAFRVHPSNKFLTYREKGQIKKFAIRDYPGMNYVKGEFESRE